MTEPPQKLTAFIEKLASLETRADRIQVLINTARRYEGVPTHVATPPYSTDRKIPGCDSQVYFYSEPRSDGSLTYHFAVENPHGVSAKALAVIIHECFSGVPPDQVAEVPSDIVYQIFGREISMGKSTGLQGMVAAAKKESERGGKTR